MKEREEGRREREKRGEAEERGERGCRGGRGHQQGWQRAPGLDIHLAVSSRSHGRLSNAPAIQIHFIRI